MYTKNTIYRVGQQNQVISYKKKGGQQNQIILNKLTNSHYASIDLKKRSNLAAPLK